MIHIAFFEGQPIVRDGLNSFFSNQENLKILFYAESKQELYTKIQQHSDLEIVVVDWIANEVHGLEICEYLHNHHPNVKIIAFTSLDDSVLTENLLAIGVSAVVSKNQPVGVLPEAIKKVYYGDFCLPQEHSFLPKPNGSGTAIVLADETSCCATC